MFIIGRVTNILLWYDWLEHANIATSNQNAIFQNNVGLLGVGDKKYRKQFKDDQRTILTADEHLSFRGSLLQNLLPKL